MGTNDEILSTRVKNETADKIRELAKKEHRNTSNMIAVLINKALKEYK